MFKIPQSKINEFTKLFETHRVQISACNVFFQNVRMLNGRHHILDRKMFDEEYKTFTSDIELETSPIDAFIPSDIEPKETPDEIDPADLMKQRLFVVNRIVPEYERIKNRITEERIRSDFNETHPVIMALVNGEATMDDIVDDVFIYWAVYKYIEQIEKIRIQIFSNMTPMIEYIVENITLNDIKNYLHTKKFNDNKINKYREDMLFFAPMEKKVCEFYLSDKCPCPFNLLDLIDIMLSNVDILGDKYIVLGMYLIADFAISDFMSNAEEKSPCEQYVVDVLSQVPTPTPEDQ